MKRRIISLALALVLCMMMALTAYAAPEVSFVVDEFDLLTDSELAQLNKQAEQVYRDTGVGIFFVFTIAEELQSLNPKLYAGDMEEYYIMIENEESWWSFSEGKGKQIDETAEEILRDAYDAEETYGEGIEAYLLAAADCFPENNGTVDTTEERLVFDEAMLLSSAEQAELNAKLQSVSSKYNAQIIVCTIESINGGDVDEFVEYLYDEMEFGYGENHDGVLLLLCMDSRDYRILTNGMTDEAIGESRIDAIGNAIASDLSDGDYAAAFDTFADKCQYYLDGHLNGFPFNGSEKFAICLIIGILAGVIVAFVLKGQLKTVRKQNQANVYVKSGSMQVTVSRDLFLYRNVSRTKKESSSSSSSGSSRSVGGGKF